jgi:hypothetical protein
MALTAAKGYTVTVTVKVSPVHDRDAGVTIYTTLMGAVVVLVSVAKKEAALVAPVKPVIPVIAVGATQV